tara:strand:+ start:236 stop:430 length:195 start_codon:yes stop_codon:yes gene_type:complete
MGNSCFKKKKQEPLLNIDYSLKQITIEEIGTCYICNKIGVEGYNVMLINENSSFFVCKECKNLK